MAGSGHKHLQPEEILTFPHPLCENFSVSNNLEHPTLPVRSEGSSHFQITTWRPREKHQLGLLHKISGLP
ncbi:hypothetical protein AV530_016732 [Patagioenas fasciata monilis]|uniref:Uncharacterized protein n=1 Tax=Patagioenas fasciata monilis TaxID=372326 RepID=A0A1V4J3D9_PATFA|nr:hypothetical protein AV530_016732 [Patagioenas fasciata monilis]